MSYLPDDRYVMPSRRALKKERRGLGRFTGRTLLGTVLPGSGLLLSGRHKSGGTILAGFVLLVVAGAAYFLSKGTMRGALSLALNTNVLLWLAVATIVLALIWLVSVLWTAVINWPSRPQTGRRVVAGLLTTVIALTLVAPTAKAVEYVFIQRNLLGSVFNAVGSRTGIAPNSGQSNAWSDVPRINVLLVGADSEDDRRGTRTDSMMLASIDTASGDTVLFGLPRNLEKAPFPSTSPLAKIWPQGFDCPGDCLLNDVWQQGETHANLYPGDPKPGLTALNESVSEITGLNPDYSVVINMASFQSLVNAMGGVDINAKERVPIGGKVENGRIVPGSIKGWIEPGQQHLDGYHAMWYARGRATSDDFSRMRRQRCMVGAIVNQVNPAMMLQRYPALAAVARDNIYTNIPQEHLPAFADLVTRMQQGTIRSLPFSNKVIDVTDPDFQLIRTKVTEAVSGVPSTPTPTASTPTDKPTSTDAPGRPPKAPSTGAPTPSGSASSSAPSDNLVKVSEAC